jgi:UDP-N-acetyl-D-glucosamine dehydrogenase
MKAGSRVTFSDPYVSTVRLDQGELKAMDETARRDADCVVIITDHAKFDYDALVKEARLIVDTRNALKGFKSANIVCL